MAQDAPAMLPDGGGEGASDSITVHVPAKRPLTDGDDALPPSTRRAVDESTKLRAVEDFTRALEKFSRASATGRGGSENVGEGLQNGSEGTAEAHEKNGPTASPIVASTRTPASPTAGTTNGTSSLAQEASEAHPANTIHPALLAQLLATSKFAPVRPPLDGTQTAPNKLVTAMDPPGPGHPGLPSPALSDELHSSLTSPANGFARPVANPFAGAAHAQHPLVNGLTVSPTQDPGRPGPPPSRSNSLSTPTQQLSMLPQPPQTPQQAVQMGRPRQPLPSEAWQNIQPTQAISVPQVPMQAPTYGPTTQQLMAQLMAQRQQLQAHQQNTTQLPPQQLAMLQQQQNYQQQGQPQRPPQSQVPQNQQLLTQRQQQHRQLLAQQQQQLMQLQHQQLLQQGQLQNQQSPLVTGSQAVAGTTAHPSPVSAVADTASPAPRPGSLVASRIHPGVLMAAIEQVRKYLSDEAPLTPYENDRLNMLRDSVGRSDWFYQTVHQLMCLQTLDPQRLPVSIRDLPPAFFPTIERMLSPNDRLPNKLLRFFADFPEPLMDIYSSGNDARRAFEYRLNQIKAFAVKMQNKWPMFIEQHQKVKAPPLVQDLCEQLGLDSVVLEWAFFQHTARQVWPQITLTEVQHMLSLHRLDSHTYHYGSPPVRRIPSEKAQARHCFRRIHEDHLARRKQGAGSLPPYQLPPDMLRIFQCFPPSMLANLPPGTSPFVVDPQALAPYLQNSQAPAQAGLAQQLSLHPVDLTTASPTVAAAAVPSARRPSQGPSASPAQVSGMLPSSSRPSPQVLPSQLANGRTAAANVLQSPASVVPSQPLPQPASGPSPIAQPIHGLTSSTPLLPPAGATRLQPREPNTARMALHQAHLRSPLLQSVRPDAERLYRHVVGYALQPTTLIRRPVQKLYFLMSDEALAQLPQMTPGEPGRPPTWSVDEGSCTYRLRCAALPKAGFTTEDAWVTADNYWPEELTFELNGRPLELRRKLHHGRYLPVNVTALLVAGKNELGVFANLVGKAALSHYAVAVEAVGTTPHARIMEGTTRLSAKESLAAITSSLSSGETIMTDADGDDITVTSSTLTISLADPYNIGAMVEMPARGAACRHRECFDLAIFLSQCPRAPAPAGTSDRAPSVVDCWRCPVCRGDVRPQTLVIDGFLVSVREQLQAAGKMYVRAIVVNADGTWRPQDDQQVAEMRIQYDSEEEGEIRDHAVVDEKAAVKKQRKESAPAQKVVEIIELH